MNTVLIVMLFILFFLTLQGWRKGILGIVYGLVSWIFIFIFVSVANPYILGYLKTETNILNSLKIWLLLILTIWDTALTAVWKKRDRII